MTNKYLLLLVSMASIPCFTAPIANAQEPAERAVPQEILEQARTAGRHGDEIPFFERFQLWMQRLTILRNSDAASWQAAIDDEAAKLQLSPEGMEHVYEVLSRLLASAMTEANVPLAEGCALLARDSTLTGEAAQAIVERNETNKSLVMQARTISFVADVSKELGNATAVAVQNRIIEWNVFQGPADTLEVIHPSYYKAYLSNWCSVFQPQAVSGP
ncbi:MAG: hypothetical protein V4603_10115 [Pseudomonadota bacterium]